MKQTNLISLTLVMLLLLAAAATSPVSAGPDEPASSLPADSVGRAVTEAQPSTDGPRVKRVVLSRTEKGSSFTRIFYDSDVEDTKDGYDWPISPGEVDLMIDFDTAMDESQTPQVKMFGSTATGKWLTSRRWRGRVTVVGGDLFGSSRGIWPMTVQAVSSSGRPLDISEEAGEQPDETSLSFEAIPVYVSSVEVLGGGRTYYEAQWEGGPDLHKLRRLDAKSVQGKKRELTVIQSYDLPSSGPMTLFVWARFSQPLTAVPSITLGGVDAKMDEPSGDGTSWVGQVPLDAVLEKNRPGETVSVVIDAKDEYGRPLDADPRTVAVLDTIDFTDLRWVNYEDARGGQGNVGGPDRWHKLGGLELSEHWLGRRADGSGKPFDVYIHWLNEDLKADVLVVEDYGYRYQFEATVDDTRLSGAYHHKSVEDLMSIKWVDVGTDNRSQGIPREVFEQIVRDKEPKQSWELQLVSETEMKGVLTAIGFRWSGRSLTEYRREPHEVILTQVGQLGEAALAPAPAPQAEQELSDQPAETRPAMEPAGEQIKWTGYRLDVSKLGTMPDIWLARLEYIEDDNGAAILYTRYPLSIIRNDETGDFSWSLNGGAEEVVEERQTQSSADTDALRVHADQLRVGMFEEGQIDTRVEQALDKFKAGAESPSDR